MVTGNINRDEALPLTLTPSHRGSQTWQAHRLGPRHLHHQLQNRRLKHRDHEAINLLVDDEWVTRSAVDSPGRWREHCDVASSTSTGSKSVDVGDRDGEDVRSSSRQL